MKTLKVQPHANKEILFLAVNNIKHCSIMFHNKKTSTDIYSFHSTLVHFEIVLKTALKMQIKTIKKLKN